MGHGRGQHQTVESGGRRDGRCEAYRLTVLQDGGAYPSMGSVLPFLTRMMAPGTYDIARVDVAARSVATNTTSTVAYRGAGRPAATAALERAMYLFAAHAGLDPHEVRRRHVITADAFSLPQALGFTSDIGHHSQA